MNINDRIKELVVFGLRDGGKIPHPLIDALIIRALNQLYRDTEIIIGKLPVIDEIEGANVYILPPPEVGHMERLHSLGRLGELDTVSIIHPEQYTQAFLAPTLDLDGRETITLINPSPATATGSLQATAVLSFDVDSYIPSAYSEDAFESVYGRVKFTLGMMSGKSWADRDMAAIGKGESLDANSRMKHKVLRNGTSRNLKMKSTVSFI